MIITILCLVALCFALYFMERNQRVFAYGKYISNLLYLNNIVGIISGKGEQFSYKNIPGYNKMLYSWKPVASFFKKPDGFKWIGEFSAMDFQILNEVEAQFKVGRVLDVIEQVKSYESSLKHT